jgi:putative membrane protein
MPFTIKENKALPLIIGASILIPIVVVVLFFAPRFEIIPGFDYYILPLVNAIINALTFFILIGALVAIKNKNIPLHRFLMTSAIVLSTIFLLSYVTYHTATEPTKFGGEGLIKSFYFFILISHILLAIVIVPLVLISYVRALSEKFDQHRKIARITLPLWLYVTSTGVIAYLLISPYYTN